MKKNNKFLMLAGLLVLTLVAGTYAYFTMEMSIDNPFATKSYGGETIEKFTPENSWEPGGKVTKEIQAKNTGEYPLYVRVKFEEKWERDGNVISGTTLTSLDSEKFFPESEAKSVVGGSSIYKNLVGVGENWIKETDGYFYYKTELAPNEMTEKLLDYVTLCNDANMGTYTASAMKYALVDESVTADKLTDTDYALSSAPDVIPEGKVLYQKKVVSLDSENAGLGNANYTLTIITELLQANADAAEENGWKIPNAN